MRSWVEATLDLLLPTELFQRAPHSLSPTLPGGRCVACGCSSPPLLPLFLSDGAEGVGNCSGENVDLTPSRSLSAGRACLEQRKEKNCRPLACLPALPACERARTLGPSPASCKGSAQPGSFRLCGDPSSSSGYLLPAPSGPQSRPFFARSLLETPFPGGPRC